MASSIPPRHLSKKLAEALGLTERCETTPYAGSSGIGKMTELARTNDSRLSVGQDCFKAALMPPSLDMQIKY
jgi:hypothetical protein